VSDEKLDIDNLVNGHVHKKNFGKTVRSGEMVMRALKLSIYTL